MAELNVNKTPRQMTIRHRGRGAQVWIYLGKLIRMFVYQNDWKVLPMAALIAGLVGMVIRNRLFITMEGTLMGGFAMVMVCIWNGCFNSIQVICRERDVIKREHRSGMHISSYIVSHMMYQALLCLLQTGVTLYVTRSVGVKYPAQGMFTPWMITDFGISMFLITYASDMMSLWVSTLAHNTTTAMTIMPFVLIFQLVFSGGMLTLPQWTHYITPFTISNPALKVIVSQGDYNSRPVMTIWDKVKKMRDMEVNFTMTTGQVLDALSDQENPYIAKLRDQKLKDETVVPDMTLRDILQVLATSDSLQSVRDYDFHLPGVTLGKLVKDLLASDRISPFLDKTVTRAATLGSLLEKMDIDGLFEKYGGAELGMDVTLGQLVDILAQNPDMREG